MHFLNSIYIVYLLIISIRRLFSSFFSNLYYLMGSGDLNLKKSWNPALLKNREKVWKLEQQVLKEHQEKTKKELKTQELQTTSELLSIHQSQKNDDDLLSRASKTSWMYKGPKDEKEADEIISEDYLLGKKKLADMGPSSSKSVNQGKNDRFDQILKAGTGSNVDFDKEKQSLDKDDPLYTMKLQELRKKEMLSKKAKLESYKQRLHSQNSAKGPSDRVSKPGYRPNNSSNTRSHYPSSRDNQYKSSHSSYRRGQSN